MFAAIILAFVNFKTANGHRMDFQNMQTKHDNAETAAVEKQDGGARGPVSNLVKKGIFHALKNAYHVRSDPKLAIPHAWVLQYVNPKWKFNKEHWKSHLYDWSAIKTFDDWRVAVKKDLKTDMSKWNDKIWLLNWFRSNKLQGPEVVWYKYSSSAWHKQQPLRWADPTFGTSAPMDTQTSYINGLFTGMNWPGIRDLDNNVDSKIKALKATPSELMGTLWKFCQKGTNGKNAGDFVIKASHLSESQGVFVVKAGKLINDVRSDFIENIPFPVKHSKTEDGYGYSKDPERMENEILQMSGDKTMTIFKAFPNVAKLTAKFKKGVQVCGGNETLAEVNLVMEFQEMIWVTWESARSKIIPRGTLIEKIRQYDVEIKVATGLGKAWGFYYNSIGSSTQMLSDEGKHLAYELAEATAIKAGVDFCRADIVVGEEGLIVSELTLVPAINYITKKPVLKHINKLIEWHQYNQQTDSEVNL